MAVIKKRAVLALGIAALATSALPVLSTGTASADYAPQSGDVVGVGGDTSQFALQFAADGDVKGDPGFNANGDKNRFVVFSATPDGNGRSAYTNSVTSGSASVALNPTDVLRAGTDPVLRVSSSGAAISALLDDQNNPEVINYIFSTSLPTAGNQSTAASEGWQYLHVVEIGTDSVQIAADGTSTHAPAGLSASELLSIYTGAVTTWNQLPNNTGGSTDTIIPLLPPSGSSIYKTFIADLTTANGGSAPTLSNPNIKTVEQNDPTAITGAANSADAILPFSAARLGLWNAGYFYNPAATFGSNDLSAGNNGHGSAFPQSGTSTPLSPGVTLLTGTPPDTKSVYDSPITDYVIFRQSDATSSTPFEPGSSLNWVETLFSDPGGSAPWLDRAPGEALVASAGVTPDYVDLGDVT